MYVLKYTCVYNDYICILTNSLISCNFFRDKKKVIKTHSFK